MADKPEGPIWIDMAQDMFDNLTMRELLHVANLALNRLTFRDIGEIFGEIGKTPRLEMKEKDDG
jgi:hypothetical protein